MQGIWDPFAPEPPVFGKIEPQTPPTRPSDRATLLFHFVGWTAAMVGFLGGGVVGKIL